MLRKRSRSHHKDQQMGPLTMSDSDSDSIHKTNSFFSIPGLFVGLTPKGLSDCDSVRSPTSPLDFRVFSNLGNPYTPRSVHCGQPNHKTWDCSKVGLSIVNSLDDDDDMKHSGKVLRFSESKNILFGQKVRTKPPNIQPYDNSFDAPKSLPRNFAIFPHTHTKSPLPKGTSDVVFEIGEAPSEPKQYGTVRSCSLDSCKSFSILSRFADRNSNLSSGNPHFNNLTTRSKSPLQFFDGSSHSNNSMHLDLNLAPAADVSSSGGFVPLSPSEIELSEDYTCVISHGPVPKKTHIYGDCILECYPNEGKEMGIPQASISAATPTPFPSNGFLNFCFHCNKKLDGGKDIYIYRGEKAFCSSSCRLEEIINDEEMEKANNNCSDEAREELLENGIFDAP